jgi:hypothetical protein
MLERVPELNWPANLFAQPFLTANTTAPLIAGAGKKSTDAQRCACGCGFNHNHAVSALEGEHGSRRVIWFRSMRCKSKYLGLAS